jgi:hypothetical protein
MLKKIKSNMKNNNSKKNLSNAKAAHLYRLQQAEQLTKTFYTGKPLLTDQHGKIIVPEGRK